MAIQRWDVARLAFLAFSLPALGVTACAEAPASGTGLRPEQALCQKWGYEPNDPVCLSTFRHIAP